MARDTLVLLVGIAIMGLVGACDGDGDKKAASSCSSDSECSGGGCFESSCYTACQAEEDCGADERCEENTTVDAARMSLCVPAPAVVQCDAESPEVVNCPLGTWSASITRETDAEADCVIDGQVTQELILSFTRSGDGQLSASFTSRNNPNPEQGTCFDYTNDDMASSWDMDAKSLEAVLTSRTECEGAPVDWDTSYGMSLSADACCQVLSGESWLEPQDPCDEASGRSSEIISFTRVETPSTELLD